MLKFVVFSKELLQVILFEFCIRFESVDGFCLVLHLTQNMGAKFNVPARETSLLQLHFNENVCVIRTIY